MDATSAAEPVLGDKSPLTQQQQQQIQGLKHFMTLLPLFGRLHEVGCARDKAGNRELFFDDYCAAAMLYLLNPLIGSLRALQHALTLPNVARASWGSSVSRWAAFPRPRRSSSLSVCWRSSRNWPAKCVRWPKIRACRSSSRR